MTERTLGRVIKLLQAIAAAKGRDVPVRLIVKGVAYRIEDVWWEPRQEGFGAACIGDDPR